MFLEIAEHLACDFLHYFQFEQLVFELFVGLFQGEIVFLERNAEYILC